MVRAYVSTGITVVLGSLNAELLDVNHGGETADMEDTTHQGSTSGWREFLVGLKDGGEVTLTLHFDPDATVPDTGDADQTLTITWPSPATKKYSATVHVSGGKNPAAALGTKMVQDVTVKITGVPNWAAS